VRRWRRQPGAEGRRAAASAALAACGGTRFASDVDIEHLRATATTPIYWVGKEFAGLPITHADPSLIVYGTCEIEGGSFTDDGCGPPVQMQHLEFQPRQWAMAVGCGRLPELRGVPTARHDGLVLFTGRRLVKIYARNRDEDVRVAEALQPLKGPKRRNLPPPDKDVVEAVETACG
jgi:hypothetical protein